MQETIKKYELTDSQIHLAYGLTTIVSGIANWIGFNVPKVELEDFYKVRDKQARSQVKEVQAVPAPVSPVVEACPEKPKAPAIWISEDCHTVKLEGEAFPLTPYQAQALGRAMELRARGIMEPHQRVILTDVGAADKKELKGTFRSNSEVRVALFTAGKHRGTFRLNLP